MKVLGDGESLEIPDNTARIYDLDDLWEHITTPPGSNISVVLTRLIADCRRLKISEKQMEQLFHTWLHAGFHLYATKGEASDVIRGETEMPLITQNHIISYTDAVFIKIHDTGSQKDKQLRAAYHLRLLGINSSFDWFLDPENMDPSGLLQEIQQLANQISQESKAVLSHANITKSTHRIKKLSEHLSMVVRIVGQALDTKNIDSPSRELITEVIDSIQKSIKHTIETVNQSHKNNKYKSDYNQQEINEIISPLEHARFSMLINHTHKRRIKNEEDYKTSLSLLDEGWLGMKGWLNRHYPDDEKKYARWEDATISNRCHIETVWQKKVMSEHQDGDTSAPHTLHKVESTIIQFSGFGKTFEDPNAYIEHCTKILQSSSPVGNIKPIQLTENQKDTLRGLLIISKVTGSVDIGILSRFIGALTLALSQDPKKKRNVIKELTLLDIEIIVFAIEYCIKRRGSNFDSMEIFESAHIKDLLDRMLQDIDICITLIDRFLQEAAFKISQLPVQPKLYLSLAKFLATQKDDLTPEQTNKLLGYADKYLSCLPNEKDIPEHQADDFKIIQRRIAYIGARKINLPEQNLTDGAIIGLFRAGMEFYKQQEAIATSEAMESDLSQRSVGEKDDEFSYGTSAICDIIQKQLFNNACNIKVCLLQSDNKLIPEVEHNVTDYIHDSMRIVVQGVQYVIVFVGSRFTRPQFERILKKNEARIARIIRTSLEEYHGRKKAIDDALHDPTTKLPISRALTNRLDSLGTTAKKALFIQFRHDFFATDSDSQQTLLGEQISNAAQLIKQDLDQVYKVDSRTFCILLNDESNINTATKRIQERLHRNKIRICTLDQVPANKLMHLGEVGINRATSRKKDIFSFDSQSCDLNTPERLAIKKAIQQVVESYKSRREMFALIRNHKKALETENNEQTRSSIKTQIHELRQRIREINWISPRLQPIVYLGGKKHVPFNPKVPDLDARKGNLAGANSPTSNSQFLHTSELGKKTLERYRQCLIHNAKYFTGRHSDKFEVLLEAKKGNPLAGVSPQDIIEIADEIGLHYEFTLAIIDATVEQLKDQPGYDAGINLNAQDLRNERLFDDVCQLFDDHDFTEYERIAYEIVEGELYLRENYIPNSPDILDDDAGRATTNMYRFAYLGCAFALDDFGTEQSNHAKFQSICKSHQVIAHRFRYIKIDRSFANGVAKDKDQQDSVNNMIDRAKRKWGKKWQDCIVVEGVEKKADIQWLLDQGIWRYQGFYFAKPAQRACHSTGTEKNCGLCGFKAFCRISGPAPEYNKKLLKLGILPGEGDPIIFEPKEEPISLGASQ